MRDKLRASVIDLRERRERDEIEKFERKILRITMNRE